MSYQVLARKWRPGTFAEIVGQTHVLQALINALEHNRLHHAFLFTGTRGVGKTTIARILAKCLNCETGVSSKPCGTCSACREISEGFFVDLIEVDAASNTGVDDMREIIENAQYRPSKGRYKVYLIDEVHMLSKSAFNALLKTLEEPPEHVKFLLATTDPQKLPVTVLSRCLQFNLKHLDTKEIHHHLLHILEQEQVKAEDQGVWQLADAAKGSLRDALSLTDQAIAFGDGEIRSQEISAMLGTIAPDLVYQLLLTLARQDGKAMLDTIQLLSEGNPDYLAALDSLLLMLHETAVYQAIPESLDPDNFNHQKIIELAGQLTAEDIQLFYQLGVNCKTDFTFAPSARSAFEMALLRMLAFRPQALPAPELSTAAGETSAKKPEPAPAASAKQVTNNAEPVSAAAKPQASQVQDKQPGTQTRISENSDKGDKPDIPEKQRVNSVGAPPSSLPEDNETWIHFAETLALNGMTQNIAMNCAFKKSDGNHLALILDENQAVLFNETHRERIAKAISDSLDRPILLEMETGHLHQESPRLRKQRLNSEKQQQAQAIFEQDPFVQEIVEQFSGTIHRDSIEALD